MNFVTDFADQAVVLPLVLVLALTLAALGWRRGAAAWLGATAATLGVVLVRKLAARACGPPLLRSPSGHTAAAGLVCGGIAVLAGLGGGFVGLAALAGATVIGLTRVALGMHSWAEVLLGGAVGVAGALALARLAGPRPARLRLRWVAVAAVTVVTLLHGLRLPAEAEIRAASFDTARLLGVCHARPRGFAPWTPTKGKPLEPVRWFRAGGGRSLAFAAMRAEPRPGAPRSLPAPASAPGSDASPRGRGPARYAPGSAPPGAAGRSLPASGRYGTRW